MCVFWTVTTISFNQSTFTVNESSGYVYPVLVLSSPYSAGGYYGSGVRIQDHRVTTGKQNLL